MTIHLVSTVRQCNAVDRNREAACETFRRLTMCHSTLISSGEDVAENDFMRKDARCWCVCVERLLGSLVRFGSDANAYRTWGYRTGRRYGMEMNGWPKMIIASVPIRPCNVC